MQSLAFTEQRTTTGFIGLGVSPIASVGVLRVANASIAIAARASGAADIELLSTTNANKVIVGDPANAATLDIKAAGDTAILRGAATKITVGAAKVTLTDGVVELGSSTAASGAVRVPKVTLALAGRNNGGTADIEIAQTTAADKIILGDPVNAATLDLKALGDTTIYRGAAAKVVVASTLVTFSDGIIEFVAGGPRILKGAGTPEGSIVAPIGSMYMDTNGGSGTTVYFKESGAGNTGWVAYSPGATDVVIAGILNQWMLNDASPYANTGSSAATLAISGTAFRNLQTGAGPNLGVALASTAKTFLTGAAGAANRPAGNNITLLAWARHRNVSGTQQIVHRKYTASGGTWIAPFISIGMSVGGGTFTSQICTGANGAGALTTINSDLIVSPGVDYLYGCAFDGATFQLFVNGELVASQALAANIDWNTAVEGPWVVGGVDSAAGNNPFIGVIRRVCVVPSAMTLAQIQNVYKHGIAST